MIAVHLVGIAAFAWPLFVSAAAVGTEAGAHGSDAPWIVALTVPLLAWTVVAQARKHRTDARTIALLGTLVAINAVLRIPKGPSGEGLMFPLPILAGWSLGGAFAFQLGAFSILVSALITGGVGPWMPFQMFALGWVGLGAAGVRRLARGRHEIATLTAYAVASSILYGFAVTFWFWPFLAAGGATSFDPQAGPVSNLGRYWSYYVLTSLPWDTGRALFANAPLVAILARPVGVLLRRTRDRFAPVYVTVK